MSQIKLVQIKHKPWLGVWLGLSLFLTAACNNAAAVQPEPSEQLPIPAETSAMSVVDLIPEQGENVALQWAGSVRPTGEHGDSCNTLIITADGEATIGTCDGEPQTVEWIANMEQDWSEIVVRFAPFETNTPGERIVFNGQGQLAGPAWERAVTAWARLAAAQLSSGQVSATGPTVLAWNLGEVADSPGACWRLIVLAYGYATAALTPCEGGNTINSVSGWIDPVDWEQFDAWLYANAPTYQDDNYLDGRGTAEMSAADITALSAWVQTVYNKISQTD